MSAENSAQSGRTPCNHARTHLNSALQLIIQTKGMNQTDSIAIGSLQQTNKLHRTNVTKATKVT